MRREKVIIKGKALISLLIGIFVLSGCGQGDDLLAETADHPVNERIDTGFAETEDKAETKDPVQGDENNAPSEDLPKPSRIPVNTKAEDIYYHSEDDIQLGRALHRRKSGGENIYLVYGTVDRNLYRILQEEVEYLFNEGRNVDDVADIIQNRASVYISENK